MKNKKGWIKIAEVSVAILLLASIVLFVISKENKEVLDISPLVQDVELSILRDIQLNNSLRAEVLGTNGEIEWISFSTSAPSTYAKIQSKTPNYLSCVAKICDPAGPCLLTSTQEESIYVESTMITSTLNNFNPRLVKLFCWEK